MRWGNELKLFVGLTLIVVGSYILFHTLVGQIELGLDLQGGVQVLMEGQDTPEHKVTAEDMKQLQAVMRQRVDELGVSEPVIQLVGSKRLSIELAGVKDPDEAIEIIGKTAMLEFKTSQGETVLTGKNLKSAEARIDHNGQPIINLEFDGEGTKILAEVTAKLAPLAEGDPNKVLAIYLDGELLTAPQVKDMIPNGKAMIGRGFSSYEEAANIAALLRGGSLPVETKIVEKRAVGPTLGLDSLEKSKVALMVGLVGIGVMLVLIYRLPGLLAVFTLMVFAVLIIAGLVAIDAVLTLPGIAGILLSVGMAADANIIIYERIKDELRQGKTLRAAVEAGFNRAFWTIFDSNFTTVLAAVVLFYLGTGPVRGFALTLILGIMANMFTAILLTRALLRITVKIPAFRHKSLYGMKEG